MILLEQKIDDWKTESADIVKTIKSTSVESFVTDFEKGGYPSNIVFDGAQSSLQDKVLSALSDEPILELLNSQTSAQINKDAIRTSFFSLMSKLEIPKPYPIKEVETWRIALAASLGCIFGMIVFGTILNLFLDMRDTGVFIGAVLGAAGMVFAVQNEKIRKILLAFVGVASVVELARMYLSIKTVRLWSKLTDRGSVLKRVMLYITIVWLLVFTGKKIRFDKRDYISVVSGVLHGYIESGILLLFLMSYEDNEKSIQPIIDHQLARSIIDLHNSSVDNLPFFADAVILEARRCGVDEISKSARYFEKEPKEVIKIKWNASMKERYKSFGNIEERDIVQIESEPVILNDKIVELGIARKVRQDIEGK